MRSTSLNKIRSTNLYLLLFSIPPQQNIRNYRIVILRIKCMCVLGTLSSIDVDWKFVYAETS